MKGSLTNEKLRKLFKKNNFELVHMTIETGYEEIKAKHEITLPSLLELVKKNIMNDAKEDGRSL